MFLCTCLMDYSNRSRSLIVTILTIFGPEEYYEVIIIHSGVGSLSPYV